MSDPIVHFEVAGPDEHALHAFYTALFDWPVNPLGPGYALVETIDGCPNGAIREAPSPELTIGVGVDNLEQSVRTATTSGGTLVMPPTDNGYVNKAQVADPAGNVITLIENTKPEV